MTGRGVLGVVCAVVCALAGCKKQAPVSEAPATTSSLVEPAEPRPPLPPRRDCTVNARISSLLGDASAPVQCGQLEPDAASNEMTTARQCVLAAVRAQKPFSLVMRLRGIDSRVEHGIVGRPTSTAYRLFWIHYDGCPRGCGDADPHSMTEACASLSDLSNTAGDVWPPIRLRCEQPEVVDHCP